MEKTVELITRVLDVSKDITCLDIVANVSLHTRPGVIALNKCERVISSRVTGNDHIMMRIEDDQVH